MIVPEWNLSKVLTIISIFYFALLSSSISRADLLEHPVRSYDRRHCPKLLFDNDINSDQLRKMVDQKTFVCFRFRE